MPGVVDGGVLPLAVRVVGELAGDLRPPSLRAAEVRGGILDPDVHRARRRLAVRKDDGAVAVDELRAVVADAEPLAEAERGAEPVACRRHVGVRQHGDHATPGH